MQLPNLPSDNFYKFITYIGLILIVFTISLGVYLEKSSWTKKFDIAFEYEEIKMDSLNVSDSINTLNQNLEFQKILFYKEYQISFDSLVQNKKMVTKPMLMDIYVISNSLLKIKTYKHLINQRKKAQEDLSAFEDLKHMFYELVYAILSVLLIFGVLILVIGIHGWKTKTQRYLDKKLKKESLLDGHYQLKATGLTKLFELHDKILPKKTINDQDWDDAAGLIANKFELIFNELKSFRSKYTAVYNNPELSELIDNSLEILNGYETFNEDEKIDNAKLVYNKIIEAISLVTNIVNQEIE